MDEDERAWSEASSMPDPLRRMHAAGLSSYGPEGEIFQMGGFASGVHHATGWRRVVGIGVAALLLTSILGSAVVSIADLATGHSEQPMTQSPRVP